jgi:hypothetical protein
MDFAAMDPKLAFLAMLVGTIVALSRIGEDQIAHFKEHWLSGRWRKAWRGR